MASGTAVGLDIGTSAVRAAEISFGRGPATLSRFGQVVLPPGAVRDGEVADPDTVAAALKQLWASAKLRSKRVIVGVANQRVIVRQVDLPWLPVDELRASLAFQVQDFIPIPVEQAILDFHPVEEISDGNGDRMLRVLLVAAARDMVLGQLEAVRRAGLEAVQVELTPFAVLRSLAEIDDLGVRGGEAEALVDIGAGVTNIVVHENGAPRFVRILLMGGDDITASLAERLGVPVDQAEQWKCENGVAAAPALVPDQHPGVRAVETATQTLLDEIRGSLDYYLAQPTAVPIGRCVISGGGALMPGFVDRLAAATRLRPVLAGPAAAVRLAKELESVADRAAFQSRLTVPVGLALAAAS